MALRIFLFVSVIFPFLLGSSYLPNAVKNNKDVLDLVGTTADGHTVDTLMGRLKELEEHIHSAAKCYPVLAAPVRVTCGTASWALAAAATQVIPASTITSDFDVHFVSVEDMNVADTYGIKLYSDSGGTTEIGCFRAQKTAARDVITALPITTPLLPANNGVWANCGTSSGGNDTIDIVLHYHTY